MNTKEGERGQEKRHYRNQYDTPFLRIRAVIPFSFPILYHTVGRGDSGGPPITWLPRLAEIRRSVKNSARSHYERKDIERLFELQPRAAQALVQGIWPSAKVGPELPARPRRFGSIPRPHPRGRQPHFPSLPAL